jgi:hypothetical protein
VDIVVSGTLCVWLYRSCDRKRQKVKRRYVGFHPEKNQRNTGKLSEIILTPINLSEIIGVKTAISITV